MAHFIPSVKLVMSLVSFRRSVWYICTRMICCCSRSSGITRDARGSWISTWIWLTRRVGGFFFFFFLDEDGDDLVRDVVLAEPWRPENRNAEGPEGASESESESESSYLEWEENLGPLGRCNSDKYWLIVLTMAPWVNFHLMLGSSERRYSREIRKIFSWWVNPERNLSN